MLDINSGTGWKCWISDQEQSWSSWEISNGRSIRYSTGEMRTLRPYWIVCKIYDHESRVALPRAWSFWYKHNNYRMVSHISKYNYVQIIINVSLVDHMQKSIVHIMKLIPKPCFHFVLVSVCLFFSYKII